MKWMTTLALLALAILIKIYRARKNQFHNLHTFNTMSPLAGSISGMVLRYSWAVHFGATQNMITPYFKSYCVPVDLPLAVDLFVGFLTALQHKKAISASHSQWK
jgi:hypothetical protein